MLKRWFCKSKDPIVYVQNEALGGLTERIQTWGWTMRFAPASFVCWPSLRFYDNLHNHLAFHSIFTLRGRTRPKDHPCMNRTSV